MTALVALAAAGLLAQSTLAATGTVPPTGDVSIDAGRVSYDVGAHRYVLEDGVVLRRGAVTLRARTARLDQTTGEVDATGDVLLTDATRAIAADGVHAVMGGPFEATDVIAFVKAGPVALAEAQDLDAARRMGRNRLSLTGKHLVATEEGRRMRLTDARLTLCDCGPNAAPSWLIRTSDADVIPNDRAILKWPVFYVTPRFLAIDHPVPVLVLPWLYVPLADRASGLLLPGFQSGGSTGASISQPLYLTLGQSADLTLTPTYAFGRLNKSAGSDPNVRGPGLETELRWAPVVGAEGRAVFRWVQDQVDESKGNSPETGTGGARFAIVGEHTQRFSETTRLRVDAALYDDPFQLRDFRTDLLLRGQRYTRSGALLEHRADAFVASADAQYLLPMDASLASDFGTFGTGLDLLQRWPSASLELLPVRLAGPLRLAARAGASRWAAFDGGAGQRFGETFGEVAGVQRWALDRIATSATTRLDGRAELSAPLAIGDVATLEPYVRGAAVGRSPDAGDASAAAWAVGGASASTAFARSYGTVRHVLAPRVEWRAGSGIAGTAPSLALDGWDPSTATASSTVVRSILSARPPGTFSQLRFAVGNRLSVGDRSLLRLDVGQDLDLRRGTLAELWAEGALDAGIFGADATVRALAFDGRPGGEPAHAHDSPLDAFTELRLGARLGDPRRAQVRASVLSIGAGGSGALVSGVDSLFDLRPSPVWTTPGGSAPESSFEPVAQASAGGQVAVGAATFGYDALFPARPVLANKCSGNGQRLLDPLQAQQHVFRVGWSSPCHCFDLAVQLTVDDCGEIRPDVRFSLANLGGGALR